MMSSSTPSSAVIWSDTHFLMSSKLALAARTSGRRSFFLNDAGYFPFFSSERSFVPKRASADWWAPSPAPSMHPPP